MKKVFCILGRSSSGKSSLSRKVAEDLGLNILKSYTTRPPRDGETKEESDHIFIDSSEVEKYRDDMIAYTKINGYEYFATKQQLLECDFYVIDPIGFYELQLKTKSMDIELVPIYITVSKKVAIQRAKKRGDNMEVFNQRYEDENKQFTDFEHSNLIWYRVLNHDSYEEGVEKLKRIIKKHI